MTGPQIEPVDPDAVLAWARRHLTLTPSQEEFLLAVFTERQPDPRELRPTPIPEEELQPYRDVIRSYLRTHAPRIVIDVDEGRPDWIHPDTWDRLEAARLGVTRPTGQADR